MELLQPFLQIFPCEKPRFFRATFGFGLVGTKENVTPIARESQFRAGRSKIGEHGSICA